MTGLCSGVEIAIEMVHRLFSRSFAIEQLFSPPFLFVSPSFQRPYSWKIETAERLLADIQAACAAEAGEIYFLGAILLVLLPQAGETATGPLPGGLFAGPERVFEIIDGQQRIVTLAILVAVLRDLARPHGMALSPRLGQALAAVKGNHSRVRLRGPDNIFLEQCIGATGACLMTPEVEVVSEPQRRLLGVRDFFVRELLLLDREELERLGMFVLENCVLVAVVTNTLDRAYQMFTVLNDAGEPLTRNDILKAELIGQIDPTKRAEATEAWDDIEAKLGRAFEQLFSFVRTRSRHGNEPIVEAVRAQVADMPGGAAAFVFDTLVPAGRIIDIVLRADHRGTPQSAKINQLLRYLGWLPGQEWVPPLLSFWSKHGRDPVALLAFLTALDRFAYGARLQGLGADKRAQRMAAVTALIEAGRAADGPWPTLQFSRDEARAIQFSLRDLHRRSPQICRLVLQRLEEHLGGQPVAGGMPLTVEHILPLKVGAGSQWRVEFPDPDVRQTLATCLGNLTLVTAAVNERASNHDFAKKLAIFFGGADQPVSNLTAELHHTTNWTATQIEARLARFVTGLDEIWGFSNAGSAI